METDVTNLDPKILKVMKALRSIESGDGKGGGGNYKAVGDSGSSTGAFQWNNGKTPVKPGQIPINFQSDARTYGFDPTDFSPANQNKVMYHKIKAQRDSGLGPEEIAALHNGASKDPKTGKYIYNNPDYGVKFRTALGGVKVNTPEKVTPENFDYGSIEDAQAEGRQHRGLELAKDFGNAITEAPMVLGGGVLNAVTQAVGGEAKPTYTNPLGTEQNALGYRDGQELGAWDTAKQGAGALAEGLSYGIGGGAIPEAAQFGKASIGAYVKPAIKAGVQSGALQGFGSSLQKGDSVPVAVAKGAGTSILGGVLGGGLGLGGAAYNKVAGYSHKIFNELDDAVRAGDDVLEAKIMSSPEYVQVNKVNKYDGPAQEKFNKDLDDAIEEGIAKSFGKSKLTRSEKAENITEGGRRTFAEHLVDSDNPIADSKLNLQNKAEDLMNNGYTPVINKIQQDGLKIAVTPKEQVIKEFDDVIDNNLATEFTREQRIAIKDKIKRTIETEAEPNGGNLDILGLEALRRNANNTFDDPNLKGKVGRALGNVIRKILEEADGTTTGDIKKIIQHINAVNKEYSDLMDGKKIYDLMSTFPGQKDSELLNKGAGFLAAGATGNNPLAYIGAHQAVKRLQNIALRARNSSLYGNMSGKAGVINSSRLIGNAQKILKNIDDIVTSNTATVNNAFKKETAVNKLLQTISPKTDSQLPVIKMWPKAKSKFNVSDPNLPTIAYGAAPFGVAGLIDKVKNIGRETYQRESEPAKDNTEELALQIANAETRGEKEPYSTWKWSNRKLGKASPLGKDLGKYQITSARLREKSMDFLGKKVTDAEFLKSPELQDKFIREQIKWQKSHGLSDEEILATHRRGWGNLKPEQIRKAVATSSNYIEQARAGK